MRKSLIIGAALLLAACGPRPSAQVEKVEICTEVGDWGVHPMMAHFSWVPLLDDYSEGSPMDWIIKMF